MWIRVEDVGDGLCAAMKSGGGCLHMDFGDGQRGEAADLAHGRLTDAGWHATDLMISHFHADHVNGLYHRYLRAQTELPPSLPYTSVYYPRIPDPRPPVEGQPARRLHHQVETYMIAFLVAEFVQQIAQTPPASYPAGSHWLHHPLHMPDVLGVLDSICGVSPVLRHPRCEDETIPVGTGQLLVLWPPREADDHLTKMMAVFVREFNAVAGEGTLLWHALHWVGENRIATSYSDMDAHQRITGQPGFPVDPDLLTGYSGGDGGVNYRPVRTAFSRLANDLSLAFTKDDEVLFMGDVGSHAIEQIMRKLVALGQVPRIDGLSHRYLLPPHHGTHWHSSMNWLTVETAISSYGQRLSYSLKSELKGIALQTVNGGAIGRRVAE